MDPRVPGPPIEPGATAGRTKAPATRTCEREPQEPPCTAPPVALPLPEHPDEPILLDGSNVVHRIGARRDGFAALLTLEEALDAAGWEVFVVVDASLRHRLSDHDQEILEDRLEAGWVQVPKGHRADEVLLEEAERLDAWLVSDDRFRDHPHPPRRRLDVHLVMGGL